MLEVLDDRRLIPLIKLVPVRQHKRENSFARMLEWSLSLISVIRFVKQLYILVIMQMF